MYFESWASFTICILVVLGKVLLLNLFWESFAWASFNWATFVAPYILY